MSRHRSSYGAHDSDLAKATTQLQTWASSTSSSLILIKGSINSKNTTKNLATEIVSLVKDNGVPAIRTLNAQTATPTNSGPIEVLKQLILQSLQLNTALMNEHSVSINVSRFQCAQSEKYWFDLLGSVLTGLPSLFIIVDIETLGPRSAESLRWPAAFMLLFQNLAARNTRTAVKVALVSYHKSLQLPAAGRIKNDVSVISIGKRGKDNIVSLAARKKALAGRNGRASANGGGFSLMRRNLLAFKDPGISERRIWISAVQFVVWSRLVLLALQRWRISEVEMKRGWAERRGVVCAVAWLTWKVRWGLALNNKNSLWTVQKETIHSLLITYFMKLLFLQTKRCHYSKRIKK